MPQMSERFVVQFNRYNFGFKGATVAEMWEDFIYGFNRYRDGELQTTGIHETWAIHCNTTVVPGMLNPGIHLLVEMVAAEMDYEWTEDQSDRVIPPSLGEISTKNLQDAAITILNWQYIFKEDDTDKETGSITKLYDMWIDRAFMKMKDALMELYQALVKHYAEEYGETDDEAID